MRWSKERFAKYRTDLLKTAQESDPPAEAVPEYKSTWEARFAELLEFRRISGEVVSWQYEAITLRLPGGVRYTPDFYVRTKDGRAEFFEVKGQLRDNARIKLRQAVELFPGFDWHIVRGDMVPMRLLRPNDVPAASRVRGR